MGDFRMITEALDLLSQLLGSLLSFPELQLSRLVVKLLSYEVRSVGNLSGVSLLFRRGRDRTCSLRWS